MKQKYCRLSYEVVVNTDLKTPDYLSFEPVKMY